ncbi:MAG: hypothetical protein QNJ64_08070 [Crocosphaera sp.]|nr:hypothetical protein [Crocosphaera sp.]
MKKGFGAKKESQKVSKKKVKKKKDSSGLKKSFNSQTKRELTVEEKTQLLKDYALENLGRDVIVAYVHLSDKYEEIPEKIVQKAEEIFGEELGNELLDEVYFDDLEDGIIEYIAKQKGGENWLESYQDLIRGLNLASWDIETMDEDEDNFIEPDEVQDCLSSFQKRKIYYGLMTVEKIRNRFLMF